MRDLAAQPTLDGYRRHLVDLLSSHIRQSLYHTKTVLGGELVRGAVDLGLPFRQRILFSVTKATRDGLAMESERRLSRRGSGAARSLTKGWAIWSSGLPSAWKRMYRLKPSDLILPGELDAPRVPVSAGWLCCYSLG
jgi:hypothetical protein